MYSCKTKKIPVKELDQEILAKPRELEMIERLKASQMIQQKQGLKHVFKAYLKHLK